MARDQLNLSSAIVHKDMLNRMSNMCLAESMTNVQMVKQLKKQNRQKKRVLGKKYNV